MIITFSLLTTSFLTSLIFGQTNGRGFIECAEFWSHLVPMWQSRHPTVWWLIAPSYIISNLSLLGNDDGTNPPSPILATVGPGRGGVSSIPNRIIKGALLDRDLNIVQDSKIALNRHLYDYDIQWSPVGGRRPPKPKQYVHAGLSIVCCSVKECR